MANPKIKVKRSSVAGKVPVPSQLERGELAVNSYDGKVYIVKDQFSVGIATTTTTVNPWLETGIGVGLSYSGDVKIVGILTVGSSSLTLDGSNNTVNVGTALTLGHSQGLQFHTQNLHSTGFEVNNINVSGVSTFASGALDFYRSGGDSYIDNDSGHLIIRNQAGGVDDGHDIYIMAKPGETGILVADDSAVYLYNDGSAKMRTDTNGILVYGNVALSGTVDGRDVATDGTKLDGIESNATADQTANEILTLIKTVDGSGSGLDADTLDGISSGSFIRSDATDTVSGALTFTNDITFDGETSGRDIVFDRSESELKFADAAQIVMGAGEDFRIFHDGYKSVIQHSGHGDLYIRAGLGEKIHFQKWSGGDTLADFNTDGSVDLYYDNTQRFSTSGVGATVFGQLDVTSGVYLTDTGTDSSAGPILDMYRNSASAADADYLGQIKFQGENDAGQKVLYSKITGKIFDASDGTEDGIIEFSFKKAGSNNISGRFRSDSLQLLNGTNFTVAGDSTFTGKVFANHGVQGNINSSGISTISGFTFPSTDGSEDQALVTDGNGSLSFKTLSGGGGGATGAGTTISTGVTTATQGQTSFTAPNVFDDGEQATAFSTQVFLNGVKQRLGASNDYQLSAPQTVTFTSGVTAGDDVTIVVYFGHTLEEEFFTATQGQKDFTLAGNLAAAKNYKVFLNGVRLRNTVDYSASAAVVLNQAARAGEQVDIVSDQAEDRLTAVENQTSFAPSDSNTTSDNMQVYMNGILLRETEDWSIGSPSITILDADGLTAGDQLDVVVRRS